MPIPANHLKEHLKKGLKSLYVVIGDEILVQQEAMDAIRNQARQEGFSERHVHVVSNHFDWSEVLAAFSSQSLFADKSLIEIQIPTGKPGKDGAQMLQKIAEQAVNSQDVLVMVQLPKLDKATKSTAWFSALDRLAEMVLVETITRAQLPRWIVERMANYGLQITAGDEYQRILHFFSDRVEGNLLAAHQEIEKLRLLFPQACPQTPKTLTWIDIENTVVNVARYDVFKLSETMLSGQAARVQRMLMGLKAEGEAEVLVHFVISEDIRALNATKDLLKIGKPMPIALRELRIWGEREKQFERALPKLKDEHLSALLQDAHIVDGIVKGMPNREWPKSSWQSLERLATKLSLLCR